MTEVASSQPQAPLSHVIRTPDQRLRVFISSTLQELLPEREAAKDRAALLREQDPAGIMTSVPGVGAVGAGLWSGGAA